MKNLFNKLPFKRLAEEKISAETRAKFPLLDKLIPWTNQIVCAFVVILLIVFIPIGGSGSVRVERAGRVERDAAGQYPIGSRVQVYDGDFKPINAYFAYLPSNPWRNIPSMTRQLPQFDNAVVLNRSIDAGISVPDTLLFPNIIGGDDIINFIRHSIDKSIEWAATAKENNVQSFSRSIPTPDGYRFNTFASTTVITGNPPHANITDAFLNFTFLITDIDGKVETVLFMTIADLRGSPIRYYSFKENDFALLREIFSESYLAEIDRREEAWQRSYAEQDALFQ
jgi:hypothetical protein